MQALDPPVSDARGALRVLLAAGDDARAARLEALLAEAGPGVFVPVPARDLDEALDLATAGDIGCVLLDLGLPGADPLAALQQLQSAALAVPVLCMERDDDADLGLRCVQAGAQDVLH